MLVKDYTTSKCISFGLLLTYRPMNLCAFGAVAFFLFGSPVCARGYSSFQNTHALTHVRVRWCVHSASDSVSMIFNTSRSAATHATYVIKTKN